MLFRSRCLGSIDRSLTHENQTYIYYWYIAIQATADGSVHYAIVGHGLTGVNKMRNRAETIRADGGTSSAESMATELGTLHVAGHTPFFPVLQRTGDNRYAQQMVVQAKLEIGQIRDIYEQEADRVADAVMQMIEPDGIRLAEAIIQTKQSPDKGMEVASGLEARIKHLSGRGQPLPEQVRAFFEPRFGHDFSMVRIHTDVQAAELARALNARAFTVGQDVVFGTGQYAPGTAAGMRLLAHELTHVVQQTDAGIVDGHRHRLIQRTIGDGHDLQSPRFAGDPILEACFDNERLLRTGDRGPAVVKIQQALIDAGFPMPRFGADGIFGAETKAAVQNYQSAHGLAIDGIIGPITVGSLDAQFAYTPPSYPPDQNFRNWFFTVMPQSPLRDGNEVTAFIQGADTFKAMVDAIRTTKNAAHFIYLLGWDLQTDFELIPGDTSSTIKELLTKASNDGVQVRAMLNSHQINPLGGTFTGFNNRPPVMIAFSGGIDINPNRFDLHDVHCRIRGPAAWDHYQIFVKRWTDNIYSNRMPINASIPIPGKCGDKHVQVALTYGNGTKHAGIDIVPNVIPPTPRGYTFAPHGDRSAKALIRQAISNTQRFIYLEDQYLVDRSMSRALARKLPSIEFLVILIAPTNSINGELFQGWRRRKDFIDNLVKVDPAKVIVCYHTKTLVHSKTWIFDDKFAIIGSANCNRRGYTHDSEQIVGIFQMNEADTLCFAHELRMNLWQKHLNLPPADVQDPIASAANWRTPPASATIANYNPNSGQDNPPIFMDTNLAWNNIIDPDGS